MSGEVSAAPPPQLVADYPAEHYYHAHPAHTAHGRYNPYYPYQVRILRLILLILTILPSPVPAPSSPASRRVQPALRLQPLAQPLPPLLQVRQAESTSSLINTKANGKSGKWRCLNVFLFVYPAPYL